MSRKAFFDSEQGKELFNSLDVGMEKLIQLRREMASTDPVKRERAYQKMLEHFNKAQTFADEMKKANPEQFEQLGRMLSDPSNYTAEQTQHIEQLQGQFINEVVNVRDVKQEKKKKFASKKWKRS